MRSISRLNKGVSNIVAYALLIAITISLSVLVYNWLKNYVSEDETVQCPDGVSLSIKDYSCLKDSNIMFFELKNNGRYNIEDILLKINNISSASIGIHDINDKLYEVTDDGSLLLGLNFDSEYNLSFAENNGSVWVKYGKFGGARYFDGINDYLNITVDPSKQFYGNFTLSAWVYPTAANNYRGIGGFHEGDYKGIVFGQYEGNSWACGYGTGTAWSSNGVIAYVNGVSTDSSKFNIPLNAWSFVTCTYEASSIFHKSDFYIGKSYNSNERFFEGYIDEFKIFSKVLDANEVKNVYLYGYTTVTMYDSKNFISLSPSSTKTFVFNYTDFEQVTVLQGQPLVIQGNKFAYCSPITQEVGQCL